MQYAARAQWEDAQLLSFEQEDFLANSFFEVFEKRIPA